MGQDRKFSDEEKLFALRTVQRYRDRWEQAERENLKADIARRAAQIEDDRQYKESFLGLDETELEKVGDEACVPKEGQEAMTDDQKNTLSKKAKFEALTKTFYDPEGAIAHARQLERDEAAAKEAHEAAVKEAEEKKEDPPAAAGPKYYPVHPEQWKKALLDLRQNFIVKHSRVLQTLFYLLGYSRE